MVLMLWINGFRHDFSTDEAFDLVVGVAAGDGTSLCGSDRRFPRTFRVQWERRRGWLRPWGPIRRQSRGVWDPDPSSWALPETAFFNGVREFPETAVHHAAVFGQTEIVREAEGCESKT